MKICTRVFALLVMLIAPTASAIAHQGHSFDTVNGHSHNVEFAVLALACVALLCMLVAAFWRRAR